MSDLVNRSTLAARPLDGANEYRRVASRYDKARS
jgi:hypothetical protein